MLCGYQYNCKKKSINAKTLNVDRTHFDVGLYNAGCNV